MKQIVLASGSPRRRELLAALVPDFQVVVSDGPEPTTDDPRADARRLAEEKAAAVVRTRPGAVVIAADTLVHDAIRTYGKPEDDNDARTMLARLQGRAHTVTTAIAVMDGDIRLADASDASVSLRELSHEDIAAFVATGIPLDKAGAYAIQEGAPAVVERWDGCYCGVMGLPLWRLRRLLARAGVRCPAPSETFARCAECPERDLSPSEKEIEE
jgi:septum formation protein